MRPFFLANLFVLLLLYSSCIHNESIIYPYENQAENIRDRLEKETISLFEAFADADELAREHPSKDTQALRAWIIEKINDELAVAFQKEEYDKALRIGSSLHALQYENPSYSMKECYEKYLTASETTNLFLLEDIKKSMLEKGLATPQIAFELLKNYYEQKAFYLFLHNEENFRKIYPELINQFPEIAKMKQEVMIKSSHIGTPDYESMMNAVVTVYLDKGIVYKGGMGYQDKAIGTGFFIDTNGHILTNHHVVAERVDPKYKGYANVTVALRDSPTVELPAKVIGYDKAFDIALLKIEKPNQHFLAQGSSQKMKTGDTIATIGNPLGLRYTVTTGIISNRDIGFFQMGRAFQVDAAINPGNSGGPLLDSHGEVVGIVFAGAPQYQGISFAIPFEWVRKSLPLLYKGGQIRRSWMGAALHENKQEKTLSFYYLLPRGNASKAGIKIDDQLIAINNRPIQTLEEAQQEIAFLQFPTIVELQIKRADELLTIPVLIEERPFTPVEKIFTSDSSAGILQLFFGIKLDLIQKTFTSRSYKITKVHKGLTPPSIDINEDDTIILYGIRYHEKEKAVSMQIRFINKEVAAMERVFAVQLSADINTIL